MDREEKKIIAESIFLTVIIVWFLIIALSY